MGNRTLALLLALPLVLLTGWVVFDSTRKGEAAPADTKVRYGLLKSGDGYGAPILYHFHFGEAEIINNKTSKEIEGIRASQEGPFVEKVLGLTTGDFRQECTYQFRTRKKFLAKGHLLWVEDLKVVLSAENMKVYVAREYAPGSCEYEETLKHELEHMAIHREVYGKYCRLLEEAFTVAKGVPSKQRPMWVEDPAKGQERLGKMIEDTANPVFDAYLAELQERQSALDTPANYRGINARCSNW